MQALRERFATLMLVRDDVLKALEEARNDKGNRKITRGESNGCGS